MTNQVTVFAFENDVIRTATGEDGQALVCASDLARACGLRKPTSSYRRVFDDYKVTLLKSTFGGDQDMMFLTESGVYQFLGGLRLRENSPILLRVERFQKWIYGEILPSIRKTGSYSVTPTEPVYDPEDQLSVLLYGHLKTRNEVLRVKREQERQLAVLTEVQTVAIEADKKADSAIALAESVEASYTGRTGYRTCLGYSKMHGLNISRKYLIVLGKKISKYCRDHGYTIQKVGDERYDGVGSYPIEILDLFIADFRYYDRML